MHNVFAEYKESEYKRMIGDLIKDKKILSESGKTRINDKEVLSPNISLMVGNNDAQKLNDLIKQNKYISYSLFKMI